MKFQNFVNFFPRVLTNNYHNYHNDILYIPELTYLFLFFHSLRTCSMYILI